MKRVKVNILVGFMQILTSDPLQISSGKPYPYGPTFNQSSVNFAIYIKEAVQVNLCLFNEDQLTQPFKEIELSAALHQTGDIWHIEIKDLPPHFVYAYRITLKENDQKSYLLLDPYAKGVAGSMQWHSQTNSPYQPLGKASAPSFFDWQGDKPLNLPLKDLVIYEMHIRGFTKDSSSEVQQPGTYKGLLEKIPYLKDLGINAVEIMPIHEFNEEEAIQVNPHTKEKLCNYFGYSTVNFFSPMSRYADQTLQDQVVNEFKMMVREFHKNGIEVILDVVYNHTFEGNQQGPTLSFRGLDSHAYYMIDGSNNYLNFSGCGNTLNTNHPVTRQLIIDSLRYWVTEMHVDGFRFDLASILTRAENGAPLGKAPIVEAITLDPLLKNTKLIAEAWDAGGLYQVGGFYPGQRWSEWNGRYRDVVRRFIKGTANYKSAFATALCGSPDLYGQGRSPICSVNFVTAHDGFSLADLVSYNSKHNEENGEENRDGFDHNDSWNCGYEGHSSNKKIVSLRERQIRNFHLALMVSQGIPMLLMGDEYAHTRHGNNNTWCQDNALNWFLWNRLETRSGFFRFYRALIHFRHQNPILKKEDFLKDQSVTWHGLKPLNVEWENDNRFIAFSLNVGEDNHPYLYIAFNAAHVGHTLTVPPAGPGQKWHWVVNTANPSPTDFFEEGSRPPLEACTFRMLSYSAIILIASPH
jgi:isoamylase